MNHLTHHPATLHAPPGIDRGGGLAAPAAPDARPAAASPSPVPDPTPTGQPGADGHGGGLVLLLILAAAVWAIGYRISVRLHPFKPCRRCEGTGKHRGAWFTHAYRACDRCGGTGREHRAFATNPYKQNPDRRRRQE